jgi:hypothetical protein
LVALELDHDDPRVDAPPGALTDDRPRPGWRPDLVALALVALVAGPVLIAAVSTLGGHWAPLGDDAVIALRASEVGSRTTPLVGAYSTRGWAHPGPVLFWVLALPERLGGSDGLALFATAGLLAAAAVGAVGLAAWRRGGLPLVALTMIGAAWLVHGLRPDVVVSFWNPYVALLPYVLFLVAAWSVACRDWRWLPVAAAVGSVLVHLHVAYATLVGAAVMAVGLGLVLTRRYPAPGERAARPSRRCTIVTLSVLAVLWAPVIGDQIFGSHNLGRIAGYFATGQAGTAGVRTGFGILSRHLGLTAPWTGGDEVMQFADVQPGSLLTLAALALVLAGLAAACCLRGRGETAALVVLAGAELAAGAWSAARLQHPMLAYLVVWMLPLAMFVWVTVAWASWDLIASAVPPDRAAARAPQGPARPGAVRSVVGRPVAAAVAVLAVALPIARTGTAWWQPSLNRQDDIIARAAATVTDEVDRHLDPGAPVRVETAGDVFAEGSVGVMAGLIRRGHPVFTSDGAAGAKWGAARVWRGQPVDAVLTVAGATAYAASDAVLACKRSGGVAEWGVYDELAPAERAEAQALAEQRYANRGVLTGPQSRRLGDLESRGYRLGAYAGPEICGTGAG